MEKEIEREEWKARSKEEEEFQLVTVSLLSYQFKPIQIG